MRTRTLLQQHYRNVISQEHMHLLAYCQALLYKGGLKFPNTVCKLHLSAVDVQISYKLKQ